MVDVLATHSATPDRAEFEDPWSRLPETADALPPGPGIDSSVVMVPIGRLGQSDSPRLSGLDAEHARILADVEDDLPPILVRRSTMRVIDGMHRLTAAQLRGQDTIAVCFFDGTENEAFLLAVRTNIAHGLPLRIAERRAAADRILRVHPEMSDRSVAGATGLAAKTVAAVRRGATGELPQLDARIGVDGRRRPVSAADGRRLAGELFALHPESSLRKVAKGAGISVGTARNVRERIRRGEDPAPPRQRPRTDRRDAPGDGSPTIRRVAEVVDFGVTLDSLRRDPSIAYSPQGRTLLRWLGARLITTADFERVLPGIPPHCAIVVARMARQTALSWAEFADALERETAI